MRLLLTYFLSVLGLLIVVNAYSQNDRFFFQKVDLPSSIAVEKITVLFADDKGFLWLGTRNGLYRWDGRTSQFYNTDSGKEQVSAIAQDRLGKIWVGYKDGHIAYVQQDNLMMLELDSSFIKNPVSSIVFNDSDKLWWGTHGNGMFGISHDTVIHLDENSGLSDDYIYDIATGNSNEFYIATDNGINIVRFNDHNSQVHIERPDQKLPDPLVKRIFKSDDTTFWVGFHQGGIYRYHPVRGILQKLWSPNMEGFGSVTGITSDNGFILAADSKNRILYLSSRFDTVFQEVNKSITNPMGQIKNLVSDVLGNAWLLTSNGLYHYNELGIQRIRMINGYSFSEIKAIACLPGNAYWIATTNQLIRISDYNKEVFTPKNILTGSQFTALSVDRAGNIWVGTMGQGIYVFSTVSRSFTHLDENNGLINDNVLSLFNSADYVWAATLGGASRLEYRNNHIINIESFSKKDGLGNNYIYDVLVDENANTWFATDGNGLVKYVNGSFTVYDEKNGLDDDVVVSLLSDNENTLWFVTAPGTIYSFDGVEFKSYSGSSDNTNIFSIASHEDLLYYVSDKGLNVLNKKSGEQSIINTELGLSNISSEINSVSENDEKICFGLQNEILVVTKNAETVFQPKTILDRISVNLKPVASTPPYEFSSNENRMLFEFSGIWHSAPHKVQFLVKLDGFDPEWEITSDRSMSYPSLPPGDYRFMVKSFLDVPGSPEDAEIFSFKIKKPYYQTASFILGLAFILVILAWILVKNREKSIKRKAVRKQEKIEFEFNMLKSQINPHFLFNSFSTLISIIDEDPKRAAEYTQALSDFFRNILETKDNDLVTVKEELKMLNNYISIQKNRFEEALEVEINLEERVISSLIPPLTFQLLIENAIKHNVLTSKKPLKITILSDKDSIVIKNNKHPKKTRITSTGIGLKNIAERYRLLTGGSIDVKDEKMIFMVILPIITHKNESSDH